MRLFIIMLLKASRVLFLSEESVCANEKNKQEPYSNADHTINAAEQEQDNPDCHVGKQDACPQGSCRSAPPAIRCFPSDLIRMR
jgi:hypothetical protein